MREYDSYTSGHHWLPRIPSHWNVLRAKYLFQEITDTGYTDLPLLSITNTNGIVLQSSTGRRNRMSEYMYFLTFTIFKTSILDIT